MSTRSGYRALVACGVVCLALSITACNTTKATVDSTVKFFSSTSPESMFTADGMVERDQQIKLFAGVSYENLRQEAASGSGQYLTSLAVLYGVPESRQAQFGKLLQEHHAWLFPADLQEDATAHVKMVTALNSVLPTSLVTP
ncbi:hypothetical protein W02_28490 [Nitrospira sp. KM1]|uniref:DUF3015 family protein n=1 Tax=Nitrospira sp. KM1 TaxID=1936990 RepID=UPI0013A7774A|nr:DUF3015 family protein [Nitrospira sp. KM1]BCA55709.1 hypothetical protein W02_28490 [Nitrospira sp. KM1]